MERNGQTSSKETMERDIGKVGMEVEEVHRFFKLVDARDWNQVSKFFKFRDPAVSAQGHYELYRKSLLRIREDCTINSRLSRLHLRALDILQCLEYDKFVTTFLLLQEKAQQFEAQSSVRGLVLNVTRNAADKEPEASKKPVPPKTKIPRPIKGPSDQKSPSIVYPWRDVAAQIMTKIRGGKVALYEEWPINMTGLHLKLFKFIEQKIKDNEPWSPITEKDVFVAASGIVNIRMSRARSVFGDKEVDEITALCLRPGMDQPSGELKAILAPLLEAYKSGGVDKLTDVVEEMIGAEATARLQKQASPNSLKRCVLDALRHLCLNQPNKAMSEGELVDVWKYVLSALSRHKLSLRSGELTSKATKWQQLLIKNEYGVDSGVATYGRKLDLQCRIDGIELQNSEVKVHGASRRQVDIQYRKNLRINQSMMLQLKNQINMDLGAIRLCALDVQGLTGLVFSMKYHRRVFISGLACTHMLRLPDSPPTWRKFLDGQTLSVMLNYVEELLEYGEQVELQALMHEEEVRTCESHTPDPQPKKLAELTLFSPSKRRRYDEEEEEVQGDKDITEELNELSDD